MADVIKCELYDHFEIACIRRSQVLLELHNGEPIEGVAVNLVAKEGKEFLILNNEDGEQQVNLKYIDTLIFAKSGERISIC